MYTAFMGNDARRVRNDIYDTNLLQMGLSSFLRTFYCRPMEIGLPLFHIPRSLFEPDTRFKFVFLNSVAKGMLITLISI